MISLVKPRDISVDQAMAALEKAVADHGPDFVYVADLCLYKINGKPACIVGHALDNLGMLGAIAPEKNESLVRSLDLGFSFKIEDVFTAAQKAQDNGRPWGEALDLARQTYDSV